MGEVGAALSSAAKAIGQARQAKQALGGGGGDTSDPGVQLQDASSMLAPSPGLDPNAGLTQGYSQPIPDPSVPVPQISMNDLAAPSQATSQAPAPADNPYTPDDGAQNPAANIGTQQDDPITVTGDSWTPQHHEGWLGKTIDVLEMLRGRGTPFKDRKDQENIDDALKTYQSNPEQAIHRVAQVDGPKAVELYQKLQTQRANQTLADQRAANFKDEGSDRLANMTGFLLQSKNPDAVYDKMLPQLRGFATQHGYSDTEAQTLLPDKYDADKITALRSQGISVYDQGRLAQEGANADRIEGYQGQEINLRKQSLKLEAANTQIRAAEADSSMKKNDSDYLSNKQHFYSNVLGPAAKIPWLYGNFMSGTFGSGSSNIPKPGTAYVSPDKTMAAKMEANGQWKIYDITKGTDHAKLVSVLGGVTGDQSANGDFVQ